MVVENLRIDVTPGGVPLVIHVSQYDAGLRQFNFTPYDKGVQMAKISGATVAVEATKPDGYAVQHPCTYNADGTITYVLQEQLAAVEGQVWSKLTWRDTSNNILGAKAIIWAVDTAGIEDGAVISDSDIPLVEQAAEFAATYDEKLAEAVASIHVIPGQVVIDGTLTVPGAAAESKTTGDAIRALQNALDSFDPLSADAKNALYACFEHVVWNVPNGSEYLEALRNALRRSDRRPELPSAYEQVEYIGVTGTQYINTGLQSRIPFKAEVEVACEQNNGTIVTAYGGAGASRFYAIGWSTFDGTLAIGCRYGTQFWSYDTNIPAPVYGQKYTVISEISVDQSNQAHAIVSYENGAFSKDVVTPTLGATIYINHLEADHSTGRDTKYYSVKLYAGSVPLFDGIPCYRKLDSVAGLYDVVSGNFFTNDGTGVFSVGGVIS